MLKTEQTLASLLFLALICSSCSLIPTVPSPKSGQHQSKVTSTEGRGDEARSVSKESFEQILTTKMGPMLTSKPEEQSEAPPAAVDDLWHRIQAGMALDHGLEEQRVQQELAWFKRHPDYLDRVSDRASRYLFYIVEEAEKRNIPLEIALLPVVESAFDPFAYSHGRAMGLWQFIPSTAKLYGLKIDWWYDGRRDVVRATNAALDYLQALHKSLDGDWFLALAAYNSGEGNVRKAMRLNRKRGLKTDFWSLELFAETRAYVPRLLALSELVANPGPEGLKLRPILNQAYFEQVDVASRIDLMKAAELADLSSDELYLLNAGFNRWSTHPEGPHELLIPVDKVDQFKKGLESLSSEQRVAWKRHQIRKGESLGSLAKQYNISISSIRQANDIRGNLIRAGDHLLIPVAAHQPGDYSLSVDSRDSNRELLLDKKYGTSPLRYLVKPGDSFWKISREHDVHHRTLARWNGMAPTDKLIAGSELLIWNKQGELLATSSTAPISRDVIRKVRYRVRPGESLSVIALKFGLSVSEIRGWNGDLRGKKYIHPGDRLTLYVNVTSL